MDIGVLVDCPECNGYGCKNCNGDGRHKYSDCPQKIIDRNTKDAIGFAELMEKGFLPCEGGLLNQSAALIEHCKFYGEEKCRVEAEWSKRR